MAISRFLLYAVFAMIPDRLRHVWLVVVAVLLVIAADQHGVKIPNLRRFLAEGASADGVQGVIPTVTCAERPDGRRPLAASRLRFDLSRAL